VSPGRVMMRAVRALRQRLAPPPLVHVLREQHGRVLDNQLLLGRNALITGAGRNIGRSIALEMAGQGANVYFTDLDAAAIADLERELRADGGRGRGYVSDVSNPDDVDALCAALTADGVLIDVLVNNAGIHRDAGLQQLDMAELRATFETNVFGPLHLTRQIVNAMIAAAHPGSVLFISSVHERTTAGGVAYSASKAALAMVVRELALELAPHRIRVNGIAPGGVGTNQHGELPPFPGSALHGSRIHPSYIGRAAVYLASDYFSEFTTGSTLTVDAGLLARPQHG
jgi:NAD(P)-dependent dehydrogenase (short-subunit alcohol dehydrogenase family)